MLKWQPDPVHAERAEARVTPSHARRSSDVLAILVNIYGSKALFVNEFRSMLSDKLLNTAGYETEREVLNLELLKKRFGDSALQSCEVMLHDVAESRRITRGIHTHFGHVPAEAEGVLVDATVVSRLCWPSLSQETFTLPPAIKREMDRYEKQFMHNKAPRKLVWKPTLGCVTLDVQFADKTIKDVTCTPLQATILISFGEQKRWQLSALAAAVGVSVEVLKRRISIWVNRGFVHEVSRSGSDVTYEAASALGSGSDGRQAVEEEDGGDAASSAAEQLAAEMRVYEQYVVGMLTNLESLPLSRIHNMLKMFVPATDGERGYDRTEQELQRFLNRMVEDGKLELAGGQYKIRG